MELMNSDYNQVLEKEANSSLKQEKIVFIIQRLTKGGAENFFITLVNNIRKQGVEPVIIILSNDNPMLNKIHPSITTYILSRNFRYDLSISKRIKEIILEEGAQKIFCIGAFTFFLSRLLFMYKPRHKFYLSLHTTIPVSLKEYFFDTLYLRFLRKSDKAIFICNNQKEYYKQKYHFRPEQSTVVYNGIDSSFSASLSTAQQALERERVRSELNIPSDAPVIVKVANFRQEKGHYYAIDALEILHSQYNLKAHLVLVGGCIEIDFNKLLSYISEKNLSKYIHFTGPQNDVKPYLAAANIFTLTSYSVETFSIAALEAMAFGLSCCLTRIGGASELIEENKTGLLCNPKDSGSIAQAWHKLLSSELDQEYIKNYVKMKFSSEQMIENYLLAFNIK